LQTPDKHLSIHNRKKEKKLKKERKEKKRPEKLCEESDKSVGPTQPHGLLISAWKETCKYWPLREQCAP